MCTKTSEGKSPGAFTRCILKIENLYCANAIHAVFAMLHPCVKLSKHGSQQMEHPVSFTDNLKKYHEACSVQWILQKLKGLIFSCG